MIDLEERQLVVTPQQYALIAGAEQALHEATDRHRLVLATILAGKDITDAEALRVERRDDQLFLIYRVPRNEKGG